jgi:ribonuclease HII
VRAKSVDRFAQERLLLKLGIERIGGVDEAGRGPLAGPVLAAVVVLPRPWIEEGIAPELAGLNDSKQLSASQREQFYAALVSLPGIAYGIAKVDAADIDNLNILAATHQAMRVAVERLTIRPQHLLVDGRPVPSLGNHQTALVKGDSLSYSIAAASVLAKVTRDRFMIEFDKVYPGYGFAEHKGYGTEAHLAAIQKLGPCPIHRRSFAPFNRTQLDLF